MGVSMPVVAKRETKQKAAKPAKKAVRAKKSPVATKADLEQFKNELLAEMRRLICAANLPAEPCDEATSQLIRESLAERGPSLTLKEARRELGL